MRSSLRQLLRSAGVRVAGFGLVLVTTMASAQTGERGPTRVARGDAAASGIATASTEARVIVKYRADASVMRVLSATTATGSAAGAEAPPQHAKVFAARLGVPLSDGSPVGPRSQVLRATGITSADLASRLAAQSDVEYAVVDERVHALRVPNDPLFFAGQTATTPASGQWYLRTPGVDGEVASVNAEGAWDVTTGTSNIVVAVVDTGITSHPDLAATLLPGYDFISDAATAGDGSGRDSDPSDPGDSVTTAESTTVSGCSSANVGPSSWHGTQTAGLVGAATGNGSGMAGVGWNVSVLPLRALGKCGGLQSDVIAAIQWAAGIAVDGVPANPNRARVINLSLGGDSGVACNSAYQDAISAVIAQGVVVVAAAGNEGLALGSPANCQGVISVTGVRHIGTKVGYSDLGSNATIAAPAGNCVNTTGTCLFPLLTTTNDGTYALGNPSYSTGDGALSLGTSFSAPLVSGTVALMLSSNPALTPAQVASALTRTARPFPTTGAGSIQRVVNGPLVPVAACVVPSGGITQSYECYCTTSTCGAGLLDAGAALTAVAVPTANIVASAASVVAGTSVTFDGSSSSGLAGRTVIGYQWTVTGGSTLAAFTTASANQPVATLVTSGAGTVTVTLTTTDSAGGTSTGTSTVTVTAATTSTPTTPTTSTGSDSSGGGGGSVSTGWLLGLLAAVAALAAQRRRVGAR